MTGQQRRAKGLIEDIIIYGGTFAAWGLLIAAFYFAFFRR